MFPDDDIDNLIIETGLAAQKAEHTKNAIALEPEFDFETGQYIVQSGKVSEITGVKAVKQWITAFLKTLTDTFYIYKGKKYGTSEKKLIGQKTLYNNGFTTSEIEREIREGLPLNPVIKNVAEINITKENEILNVDLTVELFNGELIKANNND